MAPPFIQSLAAFAARAGCERLPESVAHEAQRVSLIAIGGAFAEVQAPLRRCAAAGAGGVAGRRVVDLDRLADFATVMELCSRPAAAARTTAGSELVAAT